MRFGQCRITNTQETVSDISIARTGRCVAGARMVGGFVLEPAQKGRKHCHPVLARYALPMTQLRKPA